MKHRFINACRSFKKQLIPKENSSLLNKLTLRVTAQPSRRSCEYYLDPGPILAAAPTWLKLLNTGGPLVWETPNDELVFTSGKEVTVGKFGLCDTDTRGVFRKLLNSISFAFCRFLSPSTWRKESNEWEFFLIKFIKDHIYDDWTIQYIGEIKVSSVELLKKAQLQLFSDKYRSCCSNRHILHASGIRET